MRFLFTSAQLTGHLDWGGLLPTAAMLARRGHQTLWASGAAVAGQVEAAGPAFQILGETGWRWPPPPALPRGVMSDAAWSNARILRAMDQWLDVDRVAAASAELITVAAAFKPDLIVTEPFMAAAAVAAERLRLPLVVAGWPAREPAAQPNPAAAGALEADFAARRAHWGITGHYFSRTGPPAIVSPLLHITYWSASWYAAPDAIPIGAQTRHVGGSAPSPRPPAADLPDPAARPWLLITLGTAFNRDPAFFSAAAQAAVAAGALPLVATGPLSPDETLDLRCRLPASTVMRPVVDFAAVLPYTCAAIHHGGAGTTHALVTHALPQIIVPHAGDQVQQAVAIARTGCGRFIRPADATAQVLADALAQVMPADSATRRAARRLRDEFAALGGPAAAATLLEQQVQISPQPFRL